MKKILTYLKKEKVLTISFVLALISCFFIKPDREYLKYVDIRVLVLLYCLMVIVKGFTDVGLFDYIAKALTSGLNNLRSLSRILIFVCFFLGMVITNDVALITFVPFAIFTLTLCKKENHIIKVVVLQTIAANLGSMATPVGNPQNLYLYSISNLSTKAFILLILPYVIVSGILLFIATFIIPKEPISREADPLSFPIKTDKKYLFLYTALFVLMLLVVFRVLNYIPVFIAITLILIVAKRAWLLKQADFSLLLTFVFLFVFVGNIGRIPAVSAYIESLISGREVLISALFSQVLSNVPAAILLSKFTEDIPGLIIGTNIGGLGTLIASMASLISFKYYSNSKNSRPLRYIGAFSVYNLLGLIILLLLRAVIA